MCLLMREAIICIQLNGLCLGALLKFDQTLIPDTLWMIVVLPGHALHEQG